MQLTGKITPENLMSLEAYSKYRKAHKAEVIAHRKLRSVRLGDHVTLQFESEMSIRYQIQEMLRIEKIFEEEAITQEIDTYAPLVPDGSNWKATMMIEYPDENERKRELARLIGVEDRMFVEVEGHARVHAIAVRADLQARQLELHDPALGIGVPPHTRARNPGRNASVSPVSQSISVP